MKFIIEQSAYSGVLKIAGKVAHDMELVTGTGKLAAGTKV